MSTVYIFILNGFSKRQKLSGFFCVPPAVTAAHTDERSVFTLHVWELRCHWLVLRILDLRSVRWRNKICWASCSFQSFRMVYSDRGGCVCVCLGKQTLKCGFEYLSVGGSSANTTCRMCSQLFLHCFPLSHFSSSQYL